MLRDGASSSVVEYAHRRLSKALNDAVKRQLIYQNPCLAVTPPKPQWEGAKPARRPGHSPAIG